MFEKLIRIRAEHERNTLRFEEARAKMEESAAKLKEEEATALVGLIEKVKMTPEQLADYLGVKDEKLSALKKKKDTAAKETTGNPVKDSDDHNKENNEMEDILNESY